MARWTKHAGRLLPALSLVSVLVLAGCGGGGDDGGVDNPVTNPGPSLSHAEQVFSDHDVPRQAWKQLELINADYAMERGLYGQGVRVAVAENVTNYNTDHVELLGRFSEYKYTNDQQDPYHGTAVASVLGGNYIGVARESLLINAPGRPDQALWAHTPSILSRSLGGTYVWLKEGRLYIPTRDQWIAAMLVLDSYDTLWINSAGNKDVPYCDQANCHWTPGADDEIVHAMYYERTRDNLMLIGMIDVFDPEAPGPGVYPADNALVQQTFMVAPGCNVYSADAYRGNNPTNTSYGRFCGTSVAAPMVSGAAAILRSAYPQLNAQEVRRILLDSANKTWTDQYQYNDCGADGQTNCGLYYFGQGLLDIEAALNLAEQRAQGTN